MSTVITDDGDAYPLLDMHGQHAKFIDHEEAIRLRREHAGKGRNP